MPVRRLWAADGIIKPLILMDDGPDVLARQRVQDMLGMVQCVDDLELPETLGALQQRQHRPLDDEVVQVFLQQGCGRNAFEEFEVLAFGRWHFLGVLIVEPLFVLEVDQTPGPDVLRQKKSAAVRAMRRY